MLLLVRHVLKLRYQINCSLEGICRLLSVPVGDPRSMRVRLARSAGLWLTVLHPPWPDSRSPIACAPLGTLKGKLCPAVAHGPGLGARPVTMAASKVALPSCGLLHSVSELTPPQASLETCDLTLADSADRSVSGLTQVWERHEHGQADIINTQLSSTAATAL